MSKGKHYGPRYHKGVRPSFAAAIGARRMEAENKAAEEMAQATTWLVIVSLNEAAGIGARRLDKFAGTFSEVCGEYSGLKNVLGIAKAETVLADRTADLFGAPVPKLHRYHASHERAAAIRAAEERAATTSLRLIAYALHKAYGFGPDRIDRIMQATAENLTDWNKRLMDDEYFGYETLRRRVEQILRVAVQLKEE